jgi:hypothetical protein
VEGNTRFHHARRLLFGRGRSILICNQTRARKPKAVSGENDRPRNEGGDLEGMRRRRQNSELKKEIMEWLDAIGAGLLFFLMFSVLYLFMAAKYAGY